MHVYTLKGEFAVYPKILHNGNDFFRKMTYSKRDIAICKLLMKNPHNNIVEIYNVGKEWFGDHYIDMELLNTDTNSLTMPNIKEIMLNVKTYLQQIGVIYIDWKMDNMGMSKNGTLKLFDFDASGLINIETNEWIIDPPHWWSYRQAIQNGMNTPIDIDNYAFCLLE